MNTDRSRCVWWSTHFETQDVHVVHVNLVNQPAREAHALTWLNRAERSRADNYKSTDGRRQFILCRAALRSLLCDKFELSNNELNFNDIRTEKPSAFVRDTAVECEFNVSHSFDHGLIAFSNRGRIGADIEECTKRYDIHGELRKVFSPREQRILRETEPSSQDEMFFRLWTVKEALIKATGDGFRLDTATFTLPESMIFGTRLNCRYRFPHLPHIQWEITRLDAEPFAAAIAREILDDPADKTRACDS